MNGLVVVLTLLALMGGLNLVAAFHHLRVGKPWRSGFNPFLEFNALEWFLAFLVFVGVIFCGYLSLR